jgi:pyridoxal phosphate enzyme (YggS family)
MIKDNISKIAEELPPAVKLVAVSKFHPVSSMMEAYDAGQRRFGENRPQEFAEKVPQMPSDVEWHFIGHLQTNKLKLVLPYAYMVQSVDSLHLLQAMENWLSANPRKEPLNVLLEYHLGAEETKHGLDEGEIRDVLAHASDYPHVVFRGLMGMATHTSDEKTIDSDFSRISSLKDSLAAEFSSLPLTELSIGMSNDWKIAVRHGATFVRIGTAIFGERQY